MPLILHHQIPLLLLPYIIPPIIVINKKIPPPANIPKSKLNVIATSDNPYKKCKY